MFTIPSIISSIWFYNWLSSIYVIDGLVSEGVAFVLDCRTWLALRDCGGTFRYGRSWLEAFTWRQGGVSFGPTPNVSPRSIAMDVNDVDDCKCARATSIGCNPLKTVFHVRTKLSRNSSERICLRKRSVLKEVDCHMCRHCHYQLVCPNVDPPSLYPHYVSYHFCFTVGTNWIVNYAHSVYVATVQ